MANLFRSRVIKSARTGELFALRDPAEDQRIIAERMWRIGLRPAKPQQPCDVGLFSDEADQLDLCEMFQDQPEDGL